MSEILIILLYQRNMFTYTPSTYYLYYLTDNSFYK